MSLKESKIILRKLSWQKVANFFLLRGSYYLSKLTGKNFHAGLPMSIAIEPTTSCNLRCPECPSGLRSFTRPTGMLDPVYFEKIINQVKDHVFSLTFYFQGEPFLHPSFLKMVALAHKKRIYTSTSTNAHFLSNDIARSTVESGLDRLIISIDGITQEVYENYRVGGQLEKVKQGVKNVVEWKKKLNSSTPHLVFQFLVVKPNQHQIKEVKQLAKELGVNEVKFKTAQVYQYEKGNPLIPTIEKYSRYQQLDNGNFTLKNKFSNECWRMWSSCVITWDGKVVPCCFDKDASHQLGQVGEQSLKQIWKGASYHQFRSAILRSRKEIDICTNCTEGTKV